MLYIYDWAFKEKMKSVFQNVFMSERSQLFKAVRNSMTAKGGNLQFPLLGMWRTDNNLESDRANYAEFHKGVTGTNDFQLGKGTVVKGINIPLTYQLDILGTSLEDADDLLTDTITFLREHPYADFNRFGFEFSFGLDLSDLSISTDYGSSNDIGTIYSHTLTVMAPEARILFIKDVMLARKVLVEFQDNHIYDFIDSNVNMTIPVE